MHYRLGVIPHSVTLDLKMRDGLKRGMCDKPEVRISPQEYGRCYYTQFQIQTGHKTSLNQPIRCLGLLNSDAHISMFASDLTSYTSVVKCQLNMEIYWYLMNMACTGSLTVQIKAREAYEQIKALIIEVHVSLGEAD